MALFASLLVLMQFGWGAIHDSSLVRNVINEMTVNPAAWMIALISPEIHAQAIGSRLVAPGGGINILNGCDGVDVVLLLVAAMLVAPITPRWRLMGMLTGSGLIYLCNQLRILALFYAYRSDKSLFNLLHGIVAPFLLVLISAVFYFVWLGILNRQISLAKVSS